MSIASEITRLQGAKADIKSAIEAKGVTVPSSAKLDTYDDYIAQITSGADVSGVTAAAGDVITGKDFVNSSGTLVHGSMTNRGAVSGSIDGLTTETYTIQSGYHNGSGTVSLTSDIEDALDEILNGPHYVGGIIFYIDSTADGTYTFYNANGTQVSAPSVGTDCTGWTYKVSGASKDKYYVVYDNLYTSNRWCPYIDGAYVEVSTGYTATAIGSGKTNTAGIMAIDNGKYIQADSNGNPTVWYTISQMRSSKLGGCDDWFVGSEDELEQLRLSGAGNSATWFGGNNIWSSSEASVGRAWYWFYDFSYWNASAKSTRYCVCGVRAF